MEIKVTEIEEIESRLLVGPFLTLDGIRNRVKENGESDVLELW